MKEMKKALCRILAALLALLPCCSVAEQTRFERLNKAECDALAQTIELILSDETNDIYCNVEYDVAFDSIMEYYVTLTTPEDEYRSSITFYGSEGNKGIEQVFISFDFNSDVLRDDDYIKCLMMVPYLGFVILSNYCSIENYDSELDKAWNVIWEYVCYGDMDAFFFYEYDATHWMGIKYFHPSTETDPYYGAVYYNINIK